MGISKMRQCLLMPSVSFSARRLPRILFLAKQNGQSSGGYHETKSRLVILQLHNHSDGIGKMKRQQAKNHGLLVKQCWIVASYGPRHLKMMQGVEIPHCTPCLRRAGSWPMGRT